MSSIPGEDTGVRPGSRVSREASGFGLRASGFRIERHRRVSTLHGPRSRKGARPMGPGLHGHQSALLHAIARGSAMECGALVDVCAIAGSISPADTRHAKDLIVRTVVMVSKMCR